MTSLADAALVARGWRFIVSGALIGGACVFGLVCLRTPVWFAVATAGGAFGGLLVRAGLIVRRSASVAPISLRLAALIREASLDEAESFIEEASRSAEGQRSDVGDTLLLGRTTIAYMRGDFAGVVEMAGRVLERPGPHDSPVAAATRFEARGMRAVASAVLGRSFQEDTDAASNDDRASSSVMARLELARALVLAKAGDRAALVASLSHHGAQIHEHGGARERALSRALRAWARTSGSAYRELPRAGAEGALRAWVRAAHPAAAEFTSDGGVEAASHEAPSKTSPAQATAAVQRRLSLVPAPPRQRAWYVVLFLAAIVGALLVDRLIDAVGIVLLAFLFVALYGYVRVTLDQPKGVFEEALRLAARGEHGPARERFRRLAARGNAQAGYELALLANREGDFEGARREIQAALVHCKAPASLEIARLMTLPGLLAESALALAALDRPAEADEELATLDAGFPDYFARTAARFRVRLVTAMRRGDQEGAAAIARTRTPSMVLDFGTDLLADLAVGDRWWVTSELPRTARAWLAAVAPKLPVETTAEEAPSAESVRPSETTRA